MERYQVNQAILDLFEDPAYLEIGVDQGVTFHTLRAARKVGVDVRFAFDVAAARAQAPDGVEYQEVASDDYFTRVMEPGRRFDVIFIDGLHTFDQTLRDLLHACQALAPGGVIVVDDVIPSTYAASIPDLDLSRRFWQATANPDGSWMGDVYRLAFFIRDYMTAFSYATVAENHGQLVMWHAPRPAVAPPRTVEAISRLQYVDTILDIDAFQIQPLAQIEQRLRQWKHAG